MDQKETICSYHSFHLVRIHGWLQKKRYRYTSHKIQDEFLDLMGKEILKNISSHLQSKFATAKEALKDVDLPISKLHGQGYDGAEGIRSGVAK